jgi:hypothetical protein
VIPKSLRRFDFLAAPLCILFVFALVYRGLLSLPMMAMMDLPAFPLHGMSALQLRDFVSSWQYQGLGRAIDFDYRELIFAALAALLRDNGEVTQKVFYLSLLPIAALSMYFMLRFLGVRSRIARVVGALVYGINPVTIGQFTGAPGQLVTIALLPLLLIGVFEVVEQRGMRLQGTLLLGVTIAIITSFNPYFPLIIAPLVLLAWVYSLALTPQKKVGLGVTLAFGMSLALSFLLTLPATLPTLSLLLSSSQQASIGTFVGDSLPTLLSQTQTCYSISTPLQLFRTVGNPCTPDSWLGYSNNLLWPQLGLILPFLSFGALLALPQESSRRRYVLLFSALGLIVILSAWSIHLEIPLSLFKRFQFLFLLRNPVKITMFLPLAYGPLIGFTVDGLQRGLSQRVASRTPGKSRRGAWLIAGVYLVGSLSLVGYNWPMLTGDLALSRAFENDHVVPPLYYIANDWMSERRQQGGFFRTLWLPFDHYTQVRLSTDSSGVSAIDEESGITNAADLKYVNFVLTALCQKQTNRLGALLAPATVKYIVVDLTSQQTGGCQVSGLEPHGAPDVFVTLLANQSDLQEIVRNQEWVVFENKMFMPRLAVFDQAVLLPNLIASDSAPDTNVLGITRMLVFADSPWLTGSSSGELAESVKAVASLEGTAPVKERSATGNSFRITQVSDTEFALSLKTEAPVFIFFGESYDPQWNAYYADGRLLQHFPAFYYGNGYYVDRTGDIQVRLLFDRQPARNLQILVSAITWVIVGVGLLMLSVWDLRNRRSGADQL